MYFYKKNYFNQSDPLGKTWARVSKSYIILICKYLNINKIYVFLTLTTKN
jgi:hypothetical protein